MSKEEFVEEKKTESGRLTWLDFAGTDKEIYSKLEKSPHKAEKFKLLCGELSYLFLELAAIEAKNDNSTGKYREDLEEKIKVKREKLRVDNIARIKTYTGASDRLAETIADECRDISSITNLANKVYKYHIDVDHYSNDSFAYDDVVEIEYTVENSKDVWYYVSKITHINDTTSMDDTITVELERVELKTEDEIINKIKTIKEC